MIVFLDFEASSLNKKSFPIEVAWVFQDGRSRSYLIRPAPDWTDWSAEAEEVHGISRGMLRAEGLPVAFVAEEMIRELAGHWLYASAPSWDGKWLSLLLRAAGLPRHALRLKRSDEAFLDAARRKMGDRFSDQEISDLVLGVIGATGPPPVHRALPDACLELDRLRMVTKAAAERAGSL
ncbi:3'-5' exonuclease [Sinorhizobium meliloti]|jgi:DNA polymerase III epsilon subunit-like protein|uniref:3'-5' exonuclease n=1 Tax=Rhizobium meliloti TaxID=382 RepID=UPI00040841F3|nr:transcriptional regulator [Sinorhizobium meliloti]MDE3821686.1 transcriptional regulator [Sinorhizobium meliloti]MDE4616590.1 transcriptional regulator [Sinorhizobium meliloti]RVG56344.1 transcriptional regulator [Sinorhizobium meliloti]RVG62576.1 transcriptional regulator [Sinorhizobium meliloti]RVH07259.1 transcriptional regulator [Sinorhizobium meliloti]